MLATVEIITDLKIHPYADRLEIAQVRGWDCCVVRGRFCQGQKVLFIQADTVVPVDREPFTFMSKHKGRVKPIKLKGLPSYGLVFSLEECGLDAGLELQTDVAGQLGVIKYEKQLASSLAGTALGYRPSWIPKTDEENLRNFPEALEEVEGALLSATLKYDGTSGSFGIDEAGEFVVCSRKLRVADGDNVYWRIARKYDIERKLREKAEALLPGKISPIFIQGEIYGPGIQKNPLGIAEIAFALFNDSGHDWDLPRVKEIEVFKAESGMLKKLVDFTNSIRYPNGTPAEGLVFRASQGPVLTSPSEKAAGLAALKWSFKIINENYEDRE